MDVNEYIARMFGHSSRLCIIRDGVCIVECKEIMNKAETIVVIEKNFTLFNPSVKHMKYFHSSSKLPISYQIGRRTSNFRVRCLLE